MLILFAPSSLCMESNTLEKSMNNKVALRLFACNPSMIWQIVRICEVVDWFLWKSFWFFLRIFFWFLVWYFWENLSSYSSKSYASIILSWEKRRYSILSIFLLCFVYREYCIIEEICHQIFLFFILQEVFCQSWLLFCFWFFSVLHQIFPP